VRSNPGLDSAKGFTFMDKDIICHRFKTDHGRSLQYLMMVEVKTRGAQLSDSQRDTIWIIDQLLRNRKDTPTKKTDRRQVEGVVTMVKSFIQRGEVRARVFGYHVLRLSGDSPDDSAEITWDSRRITLEQLVGLLRFDLDPDNLLPMDNRSHHTKAPMPLFEMK
jgi:hypothetical protein